jgi:DNA polymerase III epsilon subunit-like protein
MGIDTALTSNSCNTKSILRRPPIIAPGECPGITNPDILAWAVDTYHGTAFIPMPDWDSQGLIRKDTNDAYADIVSVGCLKKSKGTRGRCEICRKLAAALYMRMYRDGLKSVVSEELSPQEQHQLDDLLSTDSETTPSKAMQNLKELTAESADTLTDSEGWVDMDGDETDELVILLNKALKSGRLLKESFLYKLLLMQAKCLTAVDGRGIRWPREIIEFARRIRWIGGKKTLDCIRGEGYQKAGGAKGGALPQPKCTFNLFLPSVDTIKRQNNSVNWFNTFTVDAARNIKKILQTSSAATIVVHLSMDEMQILRGITYRKEVHLVLGSTKGPIKEDELSSYPLKQVMESQAENALVFMLTRLDGTMFLPIHCVFTKKANGLQQFEAVKPVYDILHSVGIHIISGSSDGYVGSDEYAKLMSDLAKTKNLTYSHIWDVDHLVKCCRNPYLDRYLIDPTTGVRFAASVLIRLCDKYSRLKVLPIAKLYPSDRQALDPITIVIKHLALFNQLDDAEGKAIGRFFGVLALLYEAFDKDNIPIAARFSRFEEVLTYFNQQATRYPAYSISSETRGHLTQTLQSLRQLHSLGYITDNLVNIGHLSTRRLEVLFSELRSKERKPTAADFVRLFSQAIEQQLIKHVRDLSITYKSKSTTGSKGYYKQKFGAQENVNISLEDLDALLNAHPELDFTTFAGDVQAVRYAEDMAQFLRPTNRSLLIREAFFKEKSGSVKTYFRCDQADCAKVFIRKADMDKHLEKHAKEPAQPILEQIDEVEQIWSYVSPKELFLFDFESTGAVKGHPESNRACQMSFLHPLSSKQFICVVNPQMPNQQGSWSFVSPTKHARKVHGITDRTLMQAKSFAVHWPILLDWIKSFGGQENVFIAHNVSFDLALLQREVQSNGFSIPTNWNFGCSINFAKLLVDAEVLLPKNKQKYGLDALLELVGIPPRSGVHDAGYDTFMTWRFMSLALNYNSFTDPAAPFEVLKIFEETNGFTLTESITEDTTIDILCRYQRRVVPST